MQSKPMVIFYKGRKRDNPESGMLDRVICLVTRSKYSHVELVYYRSQTSNLIYTWGASPRDFGVRKAVITMNPQHWDVYELNTEKTIEEMHVWFGKEDGSKYDWFGALGSRYRFFKQSKTRWFCSEIVGSFLDREKPHLLSPGKLFNALRPKLTKVG